MGNKFDCAYNELMAGIKENGGLDDFLALQDIQRRRIFINDEIDSDSVQFACDWIMTYNYEDRETPPEERKQIMLYIDTVGGSVDAGFKLIDTILLSKTEIRVVCMEHCYSMGFLIFLAGHKRYASKHAKFLLHDGSTFIWDSSSKVRDRVEFETKADDAVRQYVIERSTISEEEYDKNTRREWYMFADEAKKNGVVDFIVGEDCGIEEVC